MRCVPNLTEEQRTEYDRMEKALNESGNQNRATLKAGYRIIRIKGHSDPNTRPMSVSTLRFDWRRCVWYLFHLSGKWNRRAYGRVVLANVSVPPPNRSVTNGHRDNRQKMPHMGRFTLR